VGWFARHLPSASADSGTADTLMLSAGVDISTMSTRLFVVAVTLSVVLSGVPPVVAAGSGSPAATVDGALPATDVAARADATDRDQPRADRAERTEHAGTTPRERAARAATRAAAAGYPVPASAFVRPAAVTAAASDGLNVSVAVPDTFDVSVRSGDSVQILVGVTDASDAGVAGVALAVEVEAPDGAVVSRSVTTDADGLAAVTYDTAGRPDGFYVVSVRKDGQERAFDFFDVGETVVAVPEFDAYGEVGTEFTVAVFVGDGGVPVPNREVSMLVFTPTFAVQSRNVTTDADGFAELVVPLSARGEYFGFADNFDGGFFSINATDRVGYVEANGDAFASVDPGDAVALTGRVLDDDRPLADADVTIRVADPFVGGAPVAEFDRRTDAYGAFAVTWDVPADAAADGAAFYDVRVLDDRGRAVGTPAAFVDVGVGPFRPDEDLAVAVETDPYVVAPGQSVDVTVTVADVDTGATVAGAAVDTRSEIGFGVLVDARTVTTGADGTASFAVDVPAAAPAPSFLDVTVRAAAGDRNGTGFGFADVADVIVEAEHGDGVVRPGDSDRVTFTATDVRTGGAASGVPVRLAARGDVVRQSVFFTDSATTGADGTATVRPAIPPSFSGEARYRQSAPGLFFDTVARVDAYDVTLSGLPGTVAPGETVTLGYATDPDAGALVGVFERPPAFFGGAALASGVAAPGETVSFTVPADAADGAEYTVDVDAMTADGRAAAAVDSFTVAGDGEGPATRTVSADGATVTAGGTVTVPVRLDAAPDGLDRFEVRVAVADAGVATVDGATAGDVGGFELVSVAADGTTATFRGTDDADVVAPGAGSVVLGRVQVAGVAAGETTLSVTVLEVVDDLGRTVPTETRPGTVTVTPAENPFEEPLGAGGLPGDLDGDGRYEDVDGDGDADFDDAVELAFVDASALTPAQVLALDFDGDGDVDFDDAVELAFQV
jgi:hypothetical protein